MVYFVAKAVEERRQAGGHWVKGDQLLQSDGGFDFQGFNQVRRFYLTISTFVSHHQFLLLSVRIELIALNLLKKQLKNLFLTLIYSCRQN